MAVRVFLRRPFSPWRCVGQAECGQRQLRRMLHVRTGICAASENEWSLDLDTDPDEVNHAPHAEPHPPHHRLATSDGRLLFSIGKRLMTADEFVEKSTRRSWEHDNGVARGDGEVGTGWGEWEVCEEVEGEEGEREPKGGEEGAKKRGLHSMRQMRKFLRGKAMVGSRLATPPSPETASLLEVVERQLSLSAGQQEVFSTVPSVLGIEGREVKERARELRKLGFTRREVETVLVSFPPILDIDFQNVHAVCGVLKKCIPGGYMLRGLLARHPFLFTKPVKQVEERVTILKNVCKDPNALGFLLHHFPILLFAPLTPSTLHTITNFTTSLSATDSEEGRGSVDHGWVAKSLYHNLSTRPARLEPGPDIGALVALLAEFQLDPTPTLIKFPGFFKTTYAHVASLLNVLTGPPLYLDSRGIHTLLGSVPDQLVWSEDAEQLQSHLDQLCSLFPFAKECCEKVVSYPGLVLPQLGLSTWKDSLASLGFSHQQTALLVSDTPNILLQDREVEFFPRLRLLLSLPEATPSCLLSCSVSGRIGMFSTLVDVLQERLSYVKRHKPEKVAGEHMESIFASRDRKFASFCGRTVEQVHSETGLVGVELKRLKSARKSSAKTRERSISDLSVTQVPSNNTVCHSSHVSPTDPPSSHDQSNSVQLKEMKPPEERVGSVEVTGRGKRRRVRQKVSAVSSDERGEIARSETGRKTGGGGWEMAGGRESGHEAVCAGVMVDVLTEALTTTSGAELSGKHETAGTQTTLTVATSPGRARKLKKSVNTGQTRSSD